MKLDRRGDIGFMEAMAGAMTVCIVLMAFTAYLANGVLVTETKETDFDWTLIDGITYDGKSYGISFTASPSEEIDQSDLTGIGFRLYGSSDTESVVYSQTFGRQSDNVCVEKRLYSVPSDETTSVTLILEVSLFS